MGFPLSTDIFGQLKWLVKQVKLLVYRVTKIENSSGATADLQGVLNNGNSATDSNIILGTGDGLTSIILDQETYHALIVNNEYGNNNITIDGNSIILDSVGDETTTVLTAGGFYLKPLAAAIPRTNVNSDGIIIQETNWNLEIYAKEATTNIPVISFYDVTYAKYQYISPNVYSVSSDTIFNLPLTNGGTYQLAVQEVPPSNDIVNIDLSTGSKTPNLTNSIGACYFNILVGSVTNSVVLNSTFKDYCTYTFFNETATARFTTNTGGQIFGTSTGITAGLILVTRRGNDFFINR